MNKKALIIHKGVFNQRPPLLSVKKSLNDNGFCVDIITKSKEDRKHMLHGESVYTTISKISITSKVIWYLKFIFLIKNCIKKEYDLLWIEGGDTLSLFGFLLINKNNTIFQMNELYDKHKFYKFLIGRFIKKIKITIVPEVNRAFIVKCRYDLKSLPEVLPHKPYYKDELIVPTGVQNVLNDIKSRCKDKKIILYQGLISKDRNLDCIAKFVSENDDYILLLLGKDYGYLNELKSNYSNIINVDYIDPPYHLEITKKSHICVISYDPTSLNKVYCAPNKIWEYSKFGKPMICTYLPGLEYLIKFNKLGYSCDFTNVETVQRGIESIESNYADISESCFSYYNNFDYNNKVLSIIDKL